MNITPNPNPNPTTPTVCGNCGVEERRLLLHYVRHRGIFRRICTSCVLRLHPQSFCPTCFLVYDRLPPPPTDTVTCLKCSSASHSHCVGAAAKASTSYTCPPCANPSAPIFDANCREIDNKSSKVLLAAARIAAASTSKAAAAARAEAERRAKEAALTRKRAREALEHVAFLVAKEKLKERNHSKAGNANNSVVANEVSARLNAVELREKERLKGFLGAQSAVVSGTRNNGAVMGTEHNERPRVNPVSNGENERSDNLGHLENNNAQEEKVNSGLYSVPPVGDQLQHMQNNHGREENMGSQQ